MAKTRAAPGRTGLSLRVDLRSGLRVGPGKVMLLEAIAATGSISGAGRALGMSYKRAWDLVEALNQGCARPVVTTSPGGRDGGGTSLTPEGAALVQWYREVERLASDAATTPLRAIDGLARGEDRARDDGQPRPALPG